MHKFTVSLLTLLVLTLTFSGWVGAEENSPLAIKEKIRDQKATAQAELKQKRTEALGEFKAKKEAAKAEFKVKIGTIKDEQKKVVAQRLDQMLSAINQRSTDHFADRLTKMTNLLTRIESRTAKAKAAGKNVVTVEGLIATAKATITQATEAVETQAAKDYTILFTSESNLGQGAKTAKTHLRTDLKATHTQVAAARKAIGDVLRALAAIRGIDDVSASNSAQVED